MNNFMTFLATDWGKLTGFDWAGLTLVVIISILMLVVYFWVWIPSNKNKFERHRDFVLRDNSKEFKNHG